MDMKRLRELRLANPFRPFYLILTDGRRCLVDEAHHMGMAPDGSRLGVAMKNGVWLLKPEQVQDVDVLPSSGINS